MGVIAGPPPSRRRRLARALILALALSCLAAAPALARDLPSLPNDSTEGWQAWQLSRVKTVTYRLIASVDVLIGGYLLTGSEIETLGLAAAVAMIWIRPRRTSCRRSAPESAPRTVSTSALLTGWR